VTVPGGQLQGRSTRLTLEPLTLPAARALLDGDPRALSALGLHCAAGFPTPDTLDGLRLVTDHGRRAPEAAWLVVLSESGEIVGDCGQKGGPDATGNVEIGYGLAASVHGRGLGSELVAALAGVVGAQPGVRRVTAEVLADNLPSRRALERAGFQLDRQAPPYVYYALVTDQ